MNARFDRGDRVRTLELVHAGHVRLPAYLRGRVGDVVSLCGAFPLADERALGLPDARVEPVYSVRFAFGDHDVVADLWESYLEPLL